MLRHNISLLALLVVGFCIGTASGEVNWPQWRGPQANGHSAENGLPVKWSAADIVWKT